MSIAAFNLLELKRMATNAGNRMNRMPKAVQSLDDNLLVARSYGTVFKLPQVRAASSTVYFS